jgi:hypothetical protein
VVGSGDELCGRLSALFQAAAHHSLTVSHLIFQALFTESSHGVQLLSFPLPSSPLQRLVSRLLFQVLFTESLQGNQQFAPPPFSNALRAPCPLCCVSFSVPCLLFRVFLCGFFAGRWSFCPGCYAGLSQGWEHCVPLICSLVGLHLPSRFGASVWWHRSPPVFSV